MVPRPGADAEDDGWVLVLAWNGTRRSTDLLVLNASDLSEQAVLELPLAVPVGFHGSWAPEDRKTGQPSNVVEKTEEQKFPSKVSTLESHSAKHVEHFIAALLALTSFMVALIVRKFRSFQNPEKKLQEALR